MRMKTGWCMLLIAGGLLVSGAYAQRVPGDIEKLRGVVTFVSSTSAYISVGSNAGVSPGDSVFITRRGMVLSRGTVGAVSSQSCVASLQGEERILVGDSAGIRIQKRILSNRLAPDSASGSSRALPAFPSVTGRVALQYVGAGSSRDGWTVSQPSLVMLMNIPALFGSGISLRFHGRAVRDLSRASPTRSGLSRSNARIYEFALAADAPGNPFGFAIGRVTSRFVTGLGPFDGAEVFVRRGKVTAGILGGFQPDFVTSGVDARRQKAALFANVAWEGGGRTGGNVTIAYGRQMFKGKLDRDFAYLQSSTRIGSMITLYQSTEIDVTGLDGEERTGKLRLANTFLTMSYAPAPWVTFDGGYDATRIVYYLESMEIRSDTLMDNTLRQGVRGGVFFRLPLRIQVGGRIHLRPAVGDLRASRTIMGTAGVRDIGHTGISANAQVAGITGIYAEGTNISGRLDFMLSPETSLDLSVERYRYTLVRTQEQQSTVTASLSVQTLLARRWYILGGLDQVWENDLPFQRVFAEVGLRF